MRSGAKTTAAIIAFLSLWLTAIMFAYRLQRWDPHGYANHATNLIYLPSGPQARVMSLGYRQIVADYYWVRALQYFTEPSYGAVRYKNLADFLEVVVAVDPDFEYAYKFSGIAIPFDAGRLEIANAHRATSLLERGVARFPNNWELRFFLGFNYLNYHQEPQKAAEQFAVASKIPGAPPYLSAFAAKVFSVGGDLERAITFAETTYEASSDADVRALMERRIQELKAEQIVRRIEEGAQIFKKHFGRYPLDLGELIRDGFPAPPPGFVLRNDGRAEPPSQYRRVVLHVPPNERSDGGVTQ